MKKCLPQKRLECNLFCYILPTHFIRCQHVILPFQEYTHTFNGPFSGTTQVSRYQKDKTNLDFTEARDSEWQWQQVGHMQVCTSLQTDDHASTQPLSFLQAGCPSCRPTNSVKALKARMSDLNDACLVILDNMQWNVLLFMIKIFLCTWTIIVFVISIFYQVRQWLELLQLDLQKLEFANVWSPLGEFPLVGNLWFIWLLYSQTTGRKSIRLMWWPVACGVCLSKPSLCLTSCHCHW